MHLTLPLSMNKYHMMRGGARTRHAQGILVRTRRECRPSKRLIWISAGQHAREWIASASAMYLIDQLVQGIQDNDPRILRVLTLFEIVVAPCVNPDGYEYSHTV